MPETAANAERPNEPPRAWYRLHLSTWLAVVLLLGVLVLLIVPGESSGVDRGKDGYLVETIEHGWPLVYLERGHYSLGPWPPPPDGVPWLDKANWRFSVGRAGQASGSKPDRMEFRPWQLTANVMTGLLILVVVGAACEWRRRRYGRVWQFSLRELCVVMLLCAAVLGWWRMHYLRSRREAEAVAEIFRDTGGPEYDGVDRASSRCGSICRRKYLGPKWLRKLLGSKPLADFYAVTDVYILARDGEGFQRFWDPLSRMVYLEELQLVEAFKGKGIGNRDFEQLGELKSLRVLSLSAWRLNDKALVHLRGLPNLRELDLGAPKVGDAGIRHLEALPNLEVLDLTGTEVTDEGIDRLKQALPNCRITY